MATLIAWWIARWWGCRPDMSIDPDLAALLARRAQQPPPTDLAALRAALEAQAIELPSRDVGTIEERDIELPGPAGGVRARLYRTHAEPQALTVFFHGGAFMAGSLGTHDSVCRELAVSSSSAVLSIDYRLAPEHPFPAGLDDCRAALRWAVAHRGTINIGGPIVVAGDSAGATLALVSAIDTCSDSNPDIAALLLLYPPADLRDGDYASRSEFAQGFGLSEAARQMMVRNYAPSEADQHDPRVSPLLSANLGDLPPTLVVTAQYDLLRDEGAALATALAQSGTQVEHVRAAGMIHGFANYSGISQAAALALDRAGAWVRRQLYDR
jgi:acetyl esterase